MRYSELAMTSTVLHFFYTLTYRHILHMYQCTFHGVTKGIVQNAAQNQQLYSHKYGPVNAQTKLNSFKTKYISGYHLMQFLSAIATDLQLVL